MGPLKTRATSKKKKRRNLPRLPRTKTRVRKDIGPFITKARRAVGLSQGALGARIGVQGSAVMRWENGRSAPTRRNFEALVAHLRTINRDLATWLWGEATGEKPPPPPPPPPPAPPPPSVAVLRAAVLELADEFDVSPRRARAELSRLMTKLRAERFSLDGVHAAIDAWNAETRGPLET